MFVAVSSVAGSVGGGRKLAGLSGIPSQVPRSNNPFADQYLRFDPSYPNGSVLKWFGSGPTPQSGAAIEAFSAMGIGSAMRDWSLAK